MPVCFAGIIRCRDGRMAGEVDGPSLTVVFTTFFGQHHFMPRSKDSAGGAGLVGPHFAIAAL